MIAFFSEPRSHEEYDTALLRGSRAVFHGGKIDASQKSLIAAMHKRRRTIAGFALLGLAIAAAIYVYVLTFDYTKPHGPKDLAIGIACFIFCPPTLLFTMCIDCEVSGWGGVFWFSIVGVLNAAIYVAIGSVVDSLKRRAKPRNLL